MTGSRRGARRRLPRAVDRAARAARLRQRHVVALVEARARRPALPGDVRLRAGARGARGARPAADPARAAPGATGAVPLPVAPHLGAPLRRCRSAAVRRDGDGRQVRHGRPPAQAPVPPPARPDGARPAHRRPHRRDPLLRLPGRRRPAGDDDRPHGRGVRRPRGHAHPGHRLPPRRATASSASARDGPRERPRARGARARSWSTRPGSGPTRSRRCSAAAVRCTSRPARASTSSCPATGSAPRAGFITKTEKSVLFVIPWGRHWIIGTTDTPWDLDLAHPAASRADIDYVLGHVNKLLRTPLDHEDVEGVYAGLRPLLAARTSPPRDLARAHRGRARARPGPDRRRQADDLPGDGTGRGRRRGAVPRATGQHVGPSITDRVPLLGRRRVRGTHQPAGRAGPGGGAARRPHRPPARKVRRAGRRGPR